MAPFAERLSETAQKWANSVAPHAEWIARTLWSKRGHSRRLTLATRLTQTRRRIVKGPSPDLPVKPGPPPLRICQTCGGNLKRGTRYCVACSIEVSRENLLNAAKAGRIATHTPQAEALRASTQKKQYASLRAWDPSDKPNWLTERTYREKIMPRLSKIQVPMIASALAISEPYATDIDVLRDDHVG
jgi:hypothetical protein